jgi:hypothetical protein
MAFVVLALASVAWAAPASAQSCNEDMTKLGKSHQTQMDAVSALIKASKGKQIDPAIFCEKTNGVVATENAMIAYLEKNKDWCGFPDEMLDNLKTNHAKNVAFNARACKVAGEMKKAKEQAANGGGPATQPLPTGPL